MVGWHHRLNGHELEQTPGGGGRQGSLMCCSPWRRRVGHNLSAEQQRDTEEVINSSLSSLSFPPLLSPSPFFSASRDHREQTAVLTPRQLSLDTGGTLILDIQPLEL